LSKKTGSISSLNFFEKKRKEVFTMSDNLSQIITALSEPFPSDEVEFKPGALNGDKTKALALAYVDSRLYFQRLNLVCPEWQDEYQVITLQDRIVVLCRLTILGITRTGDGECLLSAGEEAEENVVTTASAQAFKRACVKFGLGAYLYALPQQWCEYDHAKRKIVNPPRLPDWAVPASEKSNDQALAEARKARTEKVLTELGYQFPAPAPAPAKPAPTPEVATISNPAGYVMPGGKYQGKTLAEIFASKEGEDYLRWFANLDGKGYQPRNGSIETQRMVRAFLAVSAAE